MKNLFFIFALVFSTTVFSANLEHGTAYTHTDFTGSVTASCDSGTRVHYCSAYGLSPSMYTRIVSSDDFDAKRFQITSQQESGKVRTKKGKMKGKYSKAINLWVRSVFQRPLLGMGTNQVTITLTNDDDVVSFHTFPVTVTRGERRSCRRGYVRMFGNDCESQARACDEYFRRGYCRN